MITVRVELEATGVVGKDNKYAHDSFETQINLSYADAKKYYAVGRVLFFGRFESLIWKQRIFFNHCTTKSLAAKLLIAMQQRVYTLLGGLTLYLTKTWCVLY